MAPSSASRPAPGHVLGGGQLHPGNTCASALNHPGIVTIHEVIRTRDTVAMVMELAEGDTLAAAPHGSAVVYTLQDLTMGDILLIAGMND